MAYRLKVVAGPGMGTECALEESEITIGRAPENGLVINDNNVSRVHAKFTLAPGNRVIVADNGSRNGVYVNDRKVNQQPLKPGDRVVIGQTVIELVVEGTRGAPRAAAVLEPAAPRRANGNGVMESTGAAPRAANVIAVKPAANVGRTSTQKPARAGVPAAPGAKPASKVGAIPMPIVVGGVLVFVIILGAVAFGGGGGPKPGDRIAINSTPRPTITPPMFPGQNPIDVSLPSNAIEKLPKDAQRWIDVGDSQRMSNNLVQARTSFRNAIKIVGNCESCQVRLDAVERQIEEKITSYERGGTQAFESGDFNRAIDQWEIAISYIGDAKVPRAMQLKARINDARTQIKQQPQ